MESEIFQLPILRDQQDTQDTVTEGFRILPFLKGQ